MKLNELVSFHQENFFEGAVQLRWVTERPELANQAAEAFVFHGPQYHGAGKAEEEGIDKDYILKDSASFVNDLLGSIVSGISGEDRNPYWMVVAGYGSGKSHLALTCSSLLGNPNGDLAGKILQNLKQADVDLASEIKEQLVKLDRPSLILSLDGMSGFHLGNTLTQSALSQLQNYGADTSAIRALSPRFQVAEQFVERNYEFRKKQFEQHLPQYDKAQLCVALQQNDESIYGHIDSIYEEANGVPIPVQGQESAQELLKILCEVYCAEDGPFSSVVILFDEFGRYLEYAAEKPRLAGDAALQQVFQGVQDYGNKIRFIGFIQYELKAYLQRFSSTDLRQLQRYITRFDSAQKWYLSTNLETLFAHMIRKQKNEFTALWNETDSNEQSKQTWHLISQALPAYKRFPVWNDVEHFSRVIVQGCWPLHPLATWFLTRQKDIVQSRSALTFIKEMIEHTAHDEALHNGRLRQISVAELVHKHMLPEMIAAERETGAMVVETLQLLLEKFEGHLSQTQRLTLVSIAVLEKMRIGRQEQNVAQNLLAQASALSLSDVDTAISELSTRLGILEWNADLGQYEFVIDASTRGQFEQWTRKALGQLDAKSIRELFALKGASETGLGDIFTDFAPRHEISTTDWVFRSSFTHSGFLKNVLSGAFKDWSEAILPNDPKGQVIYLYLHADEDHDEIYAKINETFEEELTRYKAPKAPIWVVALLDTKNSIAEQLARINLLETNLNPQDKEKYRRFIPEELQRSRTKLHSSITDSVKNRRSWVAGVEGFEEKRLKATGEKIFKEIYPNAVTFTFDGFTSSAGGGPADVATLTRNLLIQGVTASWIQAQPQRLKNRANNLLANKWGALSPRGDLLPPSNLTVRLVYEMVLERHQSSPNLTLLDSYLTLIKPPYGMNSASAGSLLGLILGNKVPAKRIQYKNKIITSTDWVNLVFSSKRGKQHHLDEAILSQTYINFPSENAEQLWRTLLQDWEMAEQYRKILDFADQAQVSNRQEPVPEILEGKYLHLLGKSDQVSSEMDDVAKKINDIEISTERAVKQENTQLLIRHGSECVSLLKKFKTEDPCWPPEIIEQVKEIMEIIRELISQRLNDWILRQSCHDVQELEKFRNRTQHAINGLKAVGLAAGAEQLLKQVQRSIMQVEARQKFSMTLANCGDYPRQPIPAETTSVQALRQEINTGDGLIESLQEARSVLSADEVSAFIRSINGRQDKLRECIKKHTEAFGRLYNVQLKTMSDVTETLKQTSLLGAVFAGTRDADELDDMAQQLKLIIKDVSTWEIEDASVELLQEILQKITEEQLSAFEVYLDEKETDAIWDISSIYMSLSDEHIAMAKKRSNSWVKQKSKLIRTIDELDQNYCKSKLKELKECPGYLSQEDKQKIDSLSISLKKRLQDIHEITRLEKVKEWRSELIKLDDVSQLRQNEVEFYLSIANNPPEDVNPKEMEEILLIKNSLVARLDELSVNDILQRIWALPIQKIKEILNAIVGHLKSRDG